MCFTAITVFIPLFTYASKNQSVWLLARSWTAPNCDRHNFKGTVYICSQNFFAGIPDAFTNFPYAKAVG